MYVIFSSNLFYSGKKWENICSICWIIRGFFIGRTGPGVCFRLYTESDYAAMSEYTTPEIQRVSLDSVLLQMIAMGLPDVRKFPFIEPPDSTAIDNSIFALKQHVKLFLVVFLSHSWVCQRRKFRSVCCSELSLVTKRSTRDKTSWIKAKLISGRTRLNYLSLNRPKKSSSPGIPVFNGWSSHQEEILIAISLYFPACN